MDMQYLEQAIGRDVLSRIAQMHGVDASAMAVTGVINPGGVKHCYLHAGEKFLCGVTDIHIEKLAAAVVRMIDKTTLEGQAFGSYDCPDDDRPAFTPLPWKARGCTNVYPVTLLEDDIASDEPLAHALRRDYGAEVSQAGSEITVWQGGTPVVLFDHMNQAQLEAWREQKFPVTFLFEEF